MKKHMAIVLMIFGVLLFEASLAGACPHHPHHEETPDKTGILLVTFGSSYPQAQNAFGNIDEKVRAAFPDTEVRWAYTSRMVRNKMTERGKTLPSPEQALAKMTDDGFTRVAVQSLHVITGKEFHYLASVADAFERMGKGLDRITVGMPLLAGQAAMEKTAAAITAAIPAERRPEEAVVLVGHGSAHPSNASYAALMWQLQQTDENLFIGTVSGFPDMGDILGALRKNGIRKAWLMPFMSVSGDHVQNDLFGDDHDTWKSAFNKAGIKVDAVNKGIAEYDVYVDIWIDHLKDALSQL